MMNRAAAGLGAVVLAACSTGCAMIINGTSDKVTASSSTPGSRVYVDGFDATTQYIRVPNDRPHVLLVRAPAHRDEVVELKPKVRPVPIVLDVLFAVPTLGIVPVVDLSFNWWTGVDAPRGVIELKPDATSPRPRPTYFIAGRDVPSTPGGAAPPAPPPPPPPTAPSSSPAPPPPEKRPAPRRGQH